MHGDHVFGFAGSVCSFGMAVANAGVWIFNGTRIPADFLESALHTPPPIGYPLRHHPARRAGQQGGVLSRRRSSWSAAHAYHRISRLTPYRVVTRSHADISTLDQGRELAFLPRAGSMRLKAGRLRHPLRTVNHSWRHSHRAPLPLAAAFVYAPNDRVSVRLRGAGPSADLAHPRSSPLPTRRRKWPFRRSTHSTMAHRRASWGPPKGVWEKKGATRVTHLSPALRGGIAFTPRTCSKEARAIFANTLVARDFFSCGR